MPSSSSRLFIWAVTLDWAQPRVMAAWVKLSVRAATLKVARVRTSM